MRTIHFNIPVISIFILFFSLGLVLSCEKNNGAPIAESKIKGKVKFQGDVVPGASLFLISKNFSKSATADAGGNYLFAGLPRGDYTVQATFNISTPTLNISGAGNARVQINQDKEEVIANVETIQGSSQGGGGGGGSCPYIYFVKGSEKIFCGDIYAGAIYQSIERDDYLRLPAPDNIKNPYQLLIANELEETQYTDLAQLLLIEHPSNMEVLLDKKGQTQCLTSPKTCRWALSDGGVDYAPFLNKEDQRSFNFNEEVSRMGFPENALGNFPEEKGMNTLTLSFDKPETCTEAKLIISAKNSAWFTKVWHDFLNLFGSYYSDWHADQKERKPNEIYAWSKQEGVALNVYYETENGWEFIESFDLVGAMKFRKMVLPFKLPLMKNKKDLRIKLECAFNFWELDYAAIDYSDNVSCPIKLLSATNLEKDNEILKIQKLDRSYMVHNQGAKQMINFYVSPYNNKIARSYFLHTKGYYEPVVKNENSPEYLKLIGFLWKGSMGEYSLDQFRVYREEHYSNSLQAEK